MLIVILEIIFTQNLNTPKVFLHEIKDC